MTKNDILNYVMTTLHNTNPAILNQMLDEISGDGSSSDELWVFRNYNQAWATLSSEDNPNYPIGRYDEITGAYLSEPTGINTNTNNLEVIEEEGQLQVRYVGENGGGNWDYCYQIYEPRKIIFDSFTMTY